MLNRTIDIVKLMLYAWALEHPPRFQWETGCDNYGSDVLSENTHQAGSGKCTIVVLPPPPEHSVYSGCRPPRNVNTRLSQKFQTELTNEILCQSHWAKRLVERQSLMTFQSF